jgi:outer membrane protein assembly factor BamB
MPLPKDNAKRRERIDWILTWIDKNNDGIWTREEFFENLRTGKESPLLAAVTPGGRGDISTTHVEWEINRGIPEVPSPIFHEGEIYLVRKGGVLSALNAQSGDSLFRERIPDAPGQYAASPVIANDHLYLVSSLGLVSIVRIGESLDLVHLFDLREFSETTPAIDASTIYFRTGDHLIAYRNKKGGNQP